MPKQFPAKEKEFDIPVSDPHRVSTTMNKK